MGTYGIQAVESSRKGILVFCKFLSANDTGLTGGHQAGIYISKQSFPILFDKAGVKNQNMEKWVKIGWQNQSESKTRFIYYGNGTRDEYRITNFGHDFPYLKPEFTGALFVLVKYTEEDYKGYILNTDADINYYLDAFGISPTETNRIISTQNINFEENEKKEFIQFISELKSGFPKSEEMAFAARRIYDKIYNHSEYIRTNPDLKLIEWTNAEYRLFRLIEQTRYEEELTKGFQSIEEFVFAANTILNRRKSRAGKSLEHHLAAIFDGNHLSYTAQAKTEKNKKPDFIFPSQDAYNDTRFPSDDLIFLAAKTTCKDRWRQIINEADRLRNKTKYLCTLQQGISVSQLDEMESENIILVVPKIYIPTYPKTHQHKIWTVRKFIQFVSEKEKSHLT